MNVKLDVNRLIVFIACCAVGCVGLFLGKVDGPALLAFLGALVVPSPLTTKDP